MTLWRLRFALALLMTVVVSGVVGYRVIEGWSWIDSIWMVFMSLTTIGFGEVHHLSTNGRWFTIALVISGLSLVSYAASQLTVYVVEGGFRKDFHERRRRARMNDMKDHFIVCGYGRTGREIAFDLRHAGRKVLVIEQDPEVALHATDEGFMVIHGDASHDDTLRQAKLEVATGFAVATSVDAVNIFVTLSARQLNADVRIMCRVDEADSSAKAMRAGADGVVSPHVIGGTNMANALLRPHSATFMAQAFARTHPELSMEDVVIGPSPAFHDNLGRLHLREQYSIMVVAIQKVDGTLVTAPGPKDVLREGDIVVAVGHPDNIGGFRAAVSDTLGVRS